MNISIMQWNIWYLEDIRDVAKLLNVIKPDMCCLQELTIDHPVQIIKNTPKYLADQMGYHFFAKELPIETTDGQKVMLANGIFSRFPISSSRFAWINQPKRGGGYDDEYRAYVEATLEVEGQVVTIGTTHMSYTHRFEGTQGKRQETDLLVRELRRHYKRFIFTGDLNAVPGSHTISEIDQSLQNVGPNLNQKTWTTKPFSYNGFEETQLKWRLDYIFATPDVEVTSSEIIQTKYSDHLPILTKLRLN